MIIMTGATSAGLDLSRDLFRRGATDLISKPWDRSGRPLIRVIENGLQEPEFAKTRKATSPLQRFAGGELAICDDRAELCGLKIITDRGFGQSLSLLRALSRKAPNGQLVRLSADELVDALGAVGSVSTITGSARSIRQNVVDRLLKHRSLVCDNESLIRNDEHGYHLREWISAAGEQTTWAVERGTTGAARLNERQEWILKELRRGVKLERAMIERRFDVHSRTAKRDLAKRGGRELVAYGEEGWKAVTGDHEC